jgi:predicted acylesterase/phospholipase RssA
MYGKRSKVEMTPRNFEANDRLTRLNDYKKRKHPEYEGWKADLAPVIESIRDRIHNPESKKRILVLILGGGMKSPYSVGQMIGLSQMGFTSDKAHTVVGISCGAPIAAYYAAGDDQMREGAKMLLDTGSHPKFIDKTRIGRTVGLTEMLDEEIGDMATGPHKLDIDAMKKSKPRLYFGVTRRATRYSDPREEFLDAKTVEGGPLRGIHASMSIPYVTGEILEVNGVKYVDGAFDPLPVKALLEDKKIFPDKESLPTDILILPSQPFNTMDAFKLNKKEWALAKLSKAIGGAGSLLSLQLEKFLLIQEQLRRSLEELKAEKSINIGIVWPPDAGLGTLSNDRDDMKATMLASARDTIKQFGEEQPAEIMIE